MRRIDGKGQAEWPWPRVLVRAALHSCSPPWRPDSAYVYRIYDKASGELLYVGCTGDPWVRMRQHHYRTKRYRMDETIFEVDAARKRISAELDEARQIRELNPRDNAMLRPADWTGYK